jgi:integrase
MHARLWVFTKAQQTPINCILAFMLVYSLLRTYIGQISDTGVFTMARTLRDTNLGTRAARLRLTPSGKPYYRIVEEGVHLGYRRLKGKAGRWCVRQYVGEQAYAVETIASADDYSDADGIAILNFPQAQEKARERMVRHARAAAGKHGPLTVAVAVGNYLEDLVARGKSDEDARYRAEAFILPAFGDVEVESLTTEALRKWLADLAAAKPRVRTPKGEPQRHLDVGDGDEARRRRRSTANRILKTFKAALNLAWREGRVPSNAAWTRVKPFPAADAPRLWFLTVAEAQRLINASEPGFQSLVQAALSTGCRYGELARLTVADFHPDSGTIHVRTSKSGKPRRVILTTEATEFFARVCAGKSGEDRIFTNGGGSPWKPSNQGRRMAEACARAKIKPAISFHGMRHTYASLAAMNGMPLIVLARNLGHGSTKMVEAHYGHLSEDYVATAVRASAPVFGLQPSNVRRIG